ncbi:MAG: YdbH domain-containing protein, partial [Pseudomonadota bacterium]|nr:YdbH domain-containing protein [Pseudomonadota bacterium]
LSLVIVLVAGAVVFREDIVRYAAPRFLSSDGQLTLARIEGLNVSTTQLTIAELEFLLHASQQRLVIIGLDVNFRLSSIVHVPELEAVTIVSMQLSADAANAANAPAQETATAQEAATADDVAGMQLSEVLTLLREFPLARVAIDELRIPQRNAPLAFALERGAGMLTADLTSSDLQLHAQFVQPNADSEARFDLELQRDATRAVDVSLMLAPADDAYAVNGSGRIDVADFNALLGALEQAPLPIPLQSAQVAWDIAGTIADDLDGGLLANDPRTFAIGLQAGSRAVLSAGLADNLGEVSIESTGRTELTITTGAGLALSGNLPLKIASSLDGEALGSDAQWRLVDCALAADAPCAINFDGTARYGNYSLHGTISTSVHGEGAYEIVTRDLAVSGIPEWLPPADLRATLQHDTDAGTLAFDATLFTRNTPTSLDVALDGIYTLDSGNADVRATLPEIEFTEQGRALSAWFPAWPYMFDVLAGRIGANADLQWRNGELRGEVSGELHELGGFYADYFFRGLDGDLQANIDTTGALPISTPPLTLTIAGVDVGLPMENLRFDFNIDTNGVLHIARFSTELLDGTITGADIDYDFARERNPVLIEFAGLQIERMLELIEYKGVEAKGAVSGEIPLTITPNGVEVAQGRLEADAPGGSIRYLAAAMGATGNAGLDLMHQALGNYQYESLTSGIEYTPDGELLLSMKLQGHNPDMRNGQRINLNLNLSDNVPALLESLQAARRIEDFLAEQYQ